MFCVHVLNNNVGNMKHTIGAEWCCGCWRHEEHVKYSLLPNQGQVADHILNSKHEVGLFSVFLNPFFSKHDLNGYQLLLHNQIEVLVIQYFINILDWLIKLIACKVIDWVMGRCLMVWWEMVFSMCIMMLLWEYVLIITTLQDKPTMLWSERMNVKWAFEHELVSKNGYFWNILMTWTKYY